MVWLGICFKGLTPLVIFDRGAINYTRYNNEALPVALKYGNKVFGNDWIFQQHGATSHTYYLTQQSYQKKFPSFIKKGH